jgi:hypothetical protein
VDIHIESKVEENNLRVTVSVPAPRIIDTSRWPHFTVEWMGRRMTGKWINQYAFQLGDRVIFRNAGEDYDQAVVTSLADLGIDLKEDKP